jgi:hypothetical protein
MHGWPISAARGQKAVMASYLVNPDAVARARQLIDSDWGRSSPEPASRMRSWSRTRAEYACWHLWLTEGAPKREAMLGRVVLAGLSQRVQG